MGRAGGLAWKLRRYAFRRDVARKVRSRYTGYRRRAEREPFKDAAALLSGVRQPAVVFDVGANIGLVTSTLLRRFPEAHVHAFEPTPATATILRERLASEPRVTLNQLAVSDSPGTVTFHVDNKTHGGGSNSLLHHSEHFATRARTDRYIDVDVRATTLDGYAAEQGVTRIDLLKLDIEGAELLALEGAKGLLESGAIDVIMMEARFIEDYVGQPMLWDLVDFMTPFGYSLFNVYAPAESEIRQALFTDAVFVSGKLRADLIRHHGPRNCGWAPQKSET